MASLMHPGSVHCLGHATVQEACLSPTWGLQEYCNLVSNPSVHSLRAWLLVRASVELWALWKVKYHYA